MPGEDRRSGVVGYRCCFCGGELTRVGRLMAAEDVEAWLATCRSCLRAFVVVEKYRRPWVIIP